MATIDRRISLDEEHPQVLHSKSLHRLANNADRIAAALEKIASSLEKMASAPHGAAPTGIKEYKRIF